MDTKLKKWKIVVSFTAFAVGVSLLLTSAVTLLELSLSDGYGGLTLKESMGQDYQTTREFRHYMEDALEEFLHMASGNMPGWYTGGVTETGVASVAVAQADVGSESPMGEVTIESGGGLTQDNGRLNEGYAWETADEVVYGTDGGWYENLITGEEGRKLADQYHEQRKNDKNLLYRIEYEGKTVYTNADGVELNGADGKLPEGYNFLLYFDGSKVRIVKDGQETDVYGDGYYREEDGDWYVPGYRNIPAEGDTAKAVIVMAAALEPLLYADGSYGASAFRDMDNRFYWLARDMRQRNRDLRGSITGIAAAVCLLLLSVIFRKSKAQADLLLAKGTGKIWFEAKLGLFIAATLFLLALFGRSQAWREWYYQYSYEGMAWSAWSIRTILAILAGNLRNNAVLFLIWFWMLYLLCNDVKHCRKSWRHGICYKLTDVLGSKDIRLPLGKKLVRGFLPVFLGGVICQLIWTGWLFYTGRRGSVAHPMRILLLMTALWALLLAIGYLYMYRVKRLAGDMDLLADRIENIRAGDYEGEGGLPEDSGLAEAMEHLDEIRTGMEQAVEVKVKSERMKVELITNVSHDIKTPLTSIVSYVELLKQEEELPEHVKDYVKILDEKAQRLKNMVQDVFEVSKAGSGQLPVDIEVLDFGKLLRQTLADMQELIQDGPVVFKTAIPEEPVMIEADGQRLYRVFQNLIVNALQYSLEGSRVYISLDRADGKAVASVKNTSRMEIERGKDYSERFTRGDESRTDGGSGLGLSIARSFTEACGGQFELETIADLFVVTVSFKNWEEACDEEA